MTAPLASPPALNRPTWMDRLLRRPFFGFGSNLSRRIPSTRRRFPNGSGSSCSSLYPWVSGRNPFGQPSFAVSSRVIVLSFQAQGQLFLLRQLSFDGRQELGDWDSFGGA